MLFPKYGSERGSLILHLFLFVPLRTVILIIALRYFLKIVLVSLRTHCLGERVGKALKNNLIKIVQFTAVYMIMSGGSQAPAGFHRER